MMPRSRSFFELYLGNPLLPNQIAIPSAFQAFGPDVHIVDPKQEEKIKALGAALANKRRKVSG